VFWECPYGLGCEQIGDRVDDLGGPQAGAQAAACTADPRDLPGALRALSAMILTWLQRQRGSVALREPDGPDGPRGSVASGSVRPGVLLEAARRDLATVQEQNPLVPVRTTAGRVPADVLDHAGQAGVGPA
jgi:hypothetical protein